MLPCRLPVTVTAPEARFIDKAVPSKLPLSANRLITRLSPVFDPEAAPSLAKDHRLDPEVLEIRIEEELGLLATNSAKDSMAPSNLAVEVLNS